MGLFRWTERSRRAALLLSQPDKAVEQVAQEAGVALTTLKVWRESAEFRERVEQHRQEAVAAIKAEGIANRQNRVDAQNDRWRRMQAIIEARATDQRYADEPGWTTGLMVQQMKSVGKMTVEEYVVDTGLLKELRDHEKQAAQELGQWTEKRELTGKDGGAIEIDDARTARERLLTLVAPAPAGADETSVRGEPE